MSWWQYGLLVCGIGMVLGGCGGSGAGAVAQASGTMTSPAEEEARSAGQGGSARPAPRTISVDDVATSGRFLPPLPTAVTSFGAAPVGRDIYIAGGYHGTPHDYSREGQSKGVYRLNTAEPSGWDRVAELAHGLQGHAAIGLDDRFCVFGGARARNTEAEPTDIRSVAAARCLGSDSGEWTSLPQLPRPRSSHAAAVVDKVAYVAGGWDMRGDPSRTTWADDVAVLDLRDPEGSWQSIDAPFKRRALGAAAAGNHLVIAGGFTPDKDASTRVDVLDLETREWSRGPDFPGDGFGLALTAVSGVVYGSGRDGTLWSYRPGDDEWEPVRPLAFARFFHQLVGMDDEVVAVGGIGGMHTRGRTRPVERVTLDPRETSYGQMTFDTPGRAKNRQGALRRGERLYFFGGNKSLGQHDFAPENFLREGWILDLATLTVEKGPSFPRARQSMVTLGTQSGGLAVGGFGHPTDVQGGESEATTQEEVFRFDWNERSWQRVSRLERGRTQFGLAEYDGRYWIFGGLNFDPDRKQGSPFDHVRSILVANAGAEPLRFEAIDVQLRGPRRAFAGAAFNGKYYLVGGMKEGFALVEDCLAFDFAAREFSEIACPGKPRLSGELVPAGDKLYLIGGSVRGSDGLEEDRTVDVLDPDTGAWSSLDFELPIRAKHLHVLPYRDQILLATTLNERQRITVGLLSPPRD